VPIKELRTLMFDASEVLRAVRIAPLVANALGLQGTYILGVEFKPDEESVVFVQDGGTRTISSEALVALLVAYCSKVRIPMPRNGTKAIRVTQDGVTLQIALDTFPCERSLSFQMPLMAMPWSKRYPL
jgi:hypothetical protein